MHRLFDTSLRLRGIPAWGRYVLTTVLVLLAFGARLWLGRWISGHSFLPFVPAVILSAFLFDRGSGIWAVVLSSALVVYFLFEPIGSFRVQDPSNLLALGLYTVIGLAIAFLVEALHRAYHDLAVAHREISMAHRQLQASEREKDLLLQELAHRVRNDLNMLGTLLQLQLRLTTEPGARDALAAAVDRVLVMGRVHERLDRRGGEAMVDMRDYLTDLCNDLQGSVAGLRPITLDVAVESHALPLERAAPVGLIVNELLTNALKHAFPDDRPGTVTVRFVRDGKDFRLSVADDGVGAPAAPQDGTGLGQRLVRSLAQQLGGSFEMAARETGTVCSVRFPAEP